MELELELKSPELELELELIFWRFAGVGIGVGVETSGVGVGVDILEICRSWNWSWSWNLRCWSWSWSWYSGDWPELELELKPLELELSWYYGVDPNPAPSVQWVNFISSACYSGLPCHSGTEGGECNCVRPGHQARLSLLVWRLCGKSIRLRGTNSPPISQVIHAVLTLNMLNYFTYLGFGLTQVDEIDSGTTIHVVCPTQPIPCQLMLWWL